MSLERLEALHKQLDGSMTVLSLISSGDLTKIKGDQIICPGVRAWQVYKDSDSQVLMSEYDPMTMWPKHEHTESIEYLICVRGSFEVTVTAMTGELKFYQTQGSCLKLPPHVMHSVFTIKGGSLMAICVPPEKGYSDG